MKFKRILILTTAIITLSGCIGESPENSSSTNSADNISSSINTQNMKSTLNDPSLIPQSDISSVGDPQNNCYNTPNALQVSSENKAVTARLITCPTALIASYLGEYVFSQPEYIGSLNLSFQQDISKDFKLTQIYNELNSNGVTGKIEQIDTADCDKLIASGHTKNQSCKITFVYVGIAKKYGPNQDNNIHLVFNSSSSSDYLLDFSIKVYHKLMDGQNYPIITTVEHNSDFTVDILSIFDEVEFLSYNDIYSQVLVNNGDGVLTPSTINPDSSIAGISIGKNFSRTEQLSYRDPTYLTQCGGEEILSGEACLFEYSQYQKSKKTFETSYARFIYSYVAESNLISYTKVNAFGPGDIIPKNYHIESSNYTIVLKKINFGNESAMYSIPLNNLVFTAETNPLFNIPTSLDSSGKILNYSYATVLGHPINEMLDQIKFDYESSCFNDFSITESISNDKYNLCKVKITPPNFLGSHPFSFLLYASYDSISGEHIKQLIGSIVVEINNKEAYPLGNYRYYFNNIEYGSNGQLSASYSNAKGVAYPVSALDYKRNCEEEGTVNFTTYNYVRNDGMAVSNAFLICDIPSTLMPKGDYFKSCTDIEFREGILSARCLNNPINNEQNLGQTSYVDGCFGSGKTITNNNGHLTCIRDNSLAKLRRLSYNGINK